jgi:hypothetical protein
VPTVWSLQNAAPYTIILAAITIAIFAPLTVPRYSRARVKT